MAQATSHGIEIMPACDGSRRLEAGVCHAAKAAFKVYNKKIDHIDVLVPLDHGGTTKDGL